jgi:hypothetical protein
VNDWTPDELIEKSTLVCNGMPTEIVVTGETSEKRDYPTIGYSATIKVLKVLKGDPTVTTIKLHYFHLAPEVHIGNGPMEICLEQGKRYRIYLIQTK